MSGISGIQIENILETRYDRHELISWWDQKLLARSRVIVAGAGALGNEVLKLLALIGVGSITVIDYDIVSPSNLARTILFRSSDIGRPKVEAAAEKIREINPNVNLTPIYGDLRFNLGLGDYCKTDLVFGCLDSINSRWALNRICQKANVEWIDGGISDFHGLVARYTPISGACYECNFTETTYARFNERYSCPFGLLSDQSENKIPTTAITSSIIAGLQVQQGLYSLHGENDQSLLPGERLMIYIKPFRMIRDILPYNPDCLAHYHLPPIINQIEGSSATSIYDAIQFARKQDPDIQDLVLPFDLLVSFICPKCETSTPVLRTREKVTQNESYCPQCSIMRSPNIVKQIGSTSPLASYSLSSLGIPPNEILTFCTSTGQEYYFQIGSSASIT
jgi:molybdopterin-synthase adenylyltransferase